MTTHGAGQTSQTTTAANVSDGPITQTRPGVSARPSTSAVDRSMKAAALFQLTGRMANEQRSNEAGDGGVGAVVVI